LTLAAAPGWSQQPATVANLLDQGERKLTIDEVTKLYADALVSGTQIGRPDERFQNTYKADGSVTGGAVWPGNTTIITGAWSIDESGRVCSDLRNSTGGKIQGCNFCFTRNGTFYASKKADRTEPGYERRFKR
jgi:hypothetical protein